MTDLRGILRSALSSNCAAIVVGGLTLFGTPAVAETDCSGGNTISATFTAQTDYYTSSATTPCFTVTLGNTLNLNGHSIRCAASSCSTAVKVNDDSTATVVKNGTISGPFDKGIDAIDAVNGLTTIQSNKIEGARLPIHGGKKIIQNVIFGAAGACGEAIRWTPNNVQGAAYQYVQDNYIDCNDPYSNGIIIFSDFTGTGTGPKVTNNFIRVANNGISHAATGGKANIVGNIIATPLFPGSFFDPIVTSAQSTFSGNVCDRDGSAVDPFACPLPEPPFTLP